MACVLNDFGAALGVIALAFFAAVFFRDGIGAVQRVIQRAPARIGGVERVTRVEHRHHQLRTGLHGEFGIHILSGDAGLLRVLCQVADLR